MFKVLVQLRLRLPVADSDNPCPLCDGTADRFGDHSRCCPCGGDRAKRHNRLRSLLAARAQAAGLSPEVEKPGLLPPRPDQSGAPEDGSRAGGGRRPADVWVGSWGVHGPAAFDLAVTSGMRPGGLPAVADDGGKPGVDYEAHKRSFQNSPSRTRTRRVGEDGRHRRSGLGVSSPRASLLAVGSQSPPDAGAGSRGSA